MTFRSDLWKISPQIFTEVLLCLWKILIASLGDICCHSHVLLMLFSHPIASAVAKEIAHREYSSEFLRTCFPSLFQGGNGDWTQGPASIPSPSFFNLEGRTPYLPKLGWHLHLLSSASKECGQTNVTLLDCLFTLDFIKLSLSGSFYGWLQGSPGCVASWHSCGTGSCGAYLEWQQPYGGGEAKTQALCQRAGGVCVVTFCERSGNFWFQGILI